MISFKLDDITDLALRSAAKELSIVDAGTITKPELIAAIKAKLSPDAPLSFAPPLSRERPPWRTPSVIVSIIALFVAIAGTLTTWWGTVHTVGKISSELEDATKENWQAVKVYEIIVSGTNTTEKWMGMTFDDIKAKYTDEALTEKVVNIGKDDMQPDQLRRVLLYLIARNAIFRTFDGKYAPVRQAAPSWDCVRRPSTEDSERAVFRILATDSGRYTTDKLVEKIRNEKSIPPDDIYAALNCMQSRRVIVVDNKGMVWSGIEALKPLENQRFPIVMPEGKK